MKLLTLLTALACMIMASCGSDSRSPSGGATSFRITTIAGTDAGSRDGGPATEALLTFPYGVAVDDQGNLYIADTENHRIRKVDTDGIITTFAGTGEEGFGGDGGPATEAKLDWPSGVAVDAGGNVYIADQENERIRKVGTDGIITTFAGSGLQLQG